MLNKPSTYLYTYFYITKVATNIIIQTDVLKAPLTQKNVPTYFQLRQNARCTYTPVKQKPTT